MLMAFSDFPSDDAKYWTHEEYLTYLQDYCKKYELDKHIVFNTTVTKVELQEKTVELPRIEIREKLVEVPKIVQMEKVVEVPEVHTVERVVEVPQYVDVEKVVEVPEEALLAQRGRAGGAEDR